MQPLARERVALVVRPLQRRVPRLAGRLALLQEGHEVARVTRQNRAAALVRQSVQVGLQTLPEVGKGRNLTFASLQCRNYILCEYRIDDRHAT